MTRFISLGSKMTPEPISRVKVQFFSRPWSISVLKYNLRSNSAQWVLGLFQKCHPFWSRHNLMNLYWHEKEKEKYFSWLWCLKMHLNCDIITRRLQHNFKIVQIQGLKRLGGGQTGSSHCQFYGCKLTL